jgi:hypothetical protein
MLALLAFSKGPAISFLLQAKDSDFDVPSCSAVLQKLYFEVSLLSSEKQKIFRKEQHSCKQRLKLAYAKHLL